MRQLTGREKILAFAVGGIAIFVLNAIFLNYLIKQHTLIRGEIDTRNREWESMQVVFKERELWQQREAWITENQPKLTNENSAGVQLLDFAKDTARKHSVTMENPVIGVLERDPAHRGVPVSFETKSSWPSLIKFLAEIQQPEQFIVFDTANIQIEPTDPTMIRGQFRMSRWYAP